MVRPGAETLALIARQEIEYLAPIPYMRAPLDIELWAGRLGGASIDVNYEVFATVDGERVLTTRALTVVVFLDSATGTPRRFSAQERDDWGRYLDEPIAFRRV